MSWKWGNAGRLHTYKHQKLYHPTSSWRKEVREEDEEVTTHQQYFIVIHHGCGVFITKFDLGNSEGEKMYLWSISSQMMEVVSNYFHF